MTESGQYGEDGERAKAADSMLALAADMNDGLLTHADAYYAVEEFARYGTAYQRQADDEFARDDA